MPLAERLDSLRWRIAAACARAGRPETSVTLIAVSKTQPHQAIRAAFTCGIRDFGENYVQEWTPKREALSDLDLRWHFIGRLQRNKAKDVAGKAALIHTVDSAALAEALGRRAAQDVLIQVNVAGEAQKGGVEPSQLAALLAALPDTIRCRGLMTMPPAAADNRQYFKALASLGRAHGLPELSMGMSDDFEAAIEEGATMVRVGTAIFGPRN